MLYAEGEQAAGLSYRYKLPIRKDNVSRLETCYDFDGVGFVMGAVARNIGEVVGKHVAKGSHILLLERSPNLFLFGSCFCFRYRC
jgi:hypothetical protein